MKISRIFGENLWSVRLEGQRKDEFARAFTNWQDVEYLEAFFENHQNDLLHGYYRLASVEEAVWSTIAEAKEMELRLLELCRNVRRGLSPGLESLFAPLNNQEFRQQRLSRRKAKGPARNTWLRIYALKIDEGCFLVVGSAIKLCRTMEERPHTRAMLKQIELVRDFLRAEGIEDLGGLLELWV